MEPMYRGIPFSPQTTLADSIGAADTIIPVSDVSVFPDPPNYATIGVDEDGETISYAAKTDHALSGCTRGVEGTPKSWASGSVIARNFTAKDLESLQKNLRKIINDAPFVSAGSAQTLTDAQKEQARVNIGASHIRVESTNIGGDTIIQVVVTDADGKVSRFNPKGSDGGVWVPEYNEDTGVIDWEYHKAGDFYPVPSPVPTGIPVPTTAAVGQTIVVSEVDENGKPTKWEAADVGGGGGGVSKASELDNDVPFVSASDSQTLTEDQQKKAQENIGLGGLVVSEGGDTLTWDGNTEGLVSVLDVYYKVSDVVITAEDIGSLLEAGNNLDDTKVKLSTGEFMSGGLLAAPGFIAIGEVCFIISEEAVGIDFDGLYFQEAGIYFAYLAEEGAEPVFASSLTIPGYTGFAKKKIKTEYIPDSVPQVQTAAVGQTIVVSEVDAEGKPTKWEARDVGVGGGTTTQMVSTTVTVGTETVVLDDTAPNQTVNLAWAVSGGKNIPAFTNYYISRSNISYPRTFNAAAYTQVWNVSAGHGNADTFVSGHQYLQVLHYVMDGDGSAVIMPGGGPLQYITPTNSMTVTGSGWIYLLVTPSGPTSTAYGFANTGTGTGTIDYLYCIDVTALQEAGTITATTINELAELFGGLELVPGQNYAGNVTSGEATLNITRDGETSTVNGGTATTTVQGGDILSVEGGSVTFVLKVLKEVYNAPISVWADKKWVAFGDSLTDETINADKKYYRHIEKKTGINVVAMGVGGTGYAKNYGDGTSYGERMTSCPSDADVITIFGSINDWNALNTGGVQIGSPSDSLDAGTYSGYVNNCIDVAISKAPYAQIALVSPMFYRGIALNLQESIAAALKAVAEYRRIKFLDLYHDSGFRIENDTFAQAYTTDYSATDETFGHPNNLAHERLIAPEFMELLRRMLLS